MKTGDRVYIKAVIAGNEGGNTMRCVTENGEIWCTESELVLRGAENEKTNDGGNADGGDDSGNSTGNGGSAGTLRQGAYRNAGIPSFRCMHSFDEHGYIASCRIEIGDEGE